MKQFRFYCDKLQCIRSDIVQTMVKYSLFQMQYECLKQIEDCSNPFVKRCTNDLNQRDVDTNKIDEFFYFFYLNYSNS